MRRCVAQAFYEFEWRAIGREASRLRKEGPRSATSPGNSGQRRAARVVRSMLRLKPALASTGRALSDAGTLASSTSSICSTGKKSNVARRHQRRRGQNSSLAKIIVQFVPTAPPRHRWRYDGDCSW